jgi:hypothetical protein
MKVEPISIHFDDDDKRSLNSIVIAEGTSDVRPMRGLFEERPDAFSLVRRRMLQNSRELEEKHIPLFGSSKPIHID